MSSRQGTYLSGSSSSGKKSPSRLIGLFSGVFVIVFEKIINVIFYERFPYALGKGGFWIVTLMAVLALLSGLLTIMSASQIIGTGEMKGTSAYFLLSRTLGYEIGGTFGIVSFLEAATASTMNLIAMGDAFMSLITFTREARSTLEPGTFYFLCLGIRIVVLAVCYITLLFGRKFVYKTRMFFFGAAALAATFILFFLMIRPSGTYGGYNIFGKPVNIEMKPWDFRVFSQNSQSHLSHDFTIAQVSALLIPLFSVVFVSLPHVSELSKPIRSIPLGTTSALLSGFTVVIVIGLVMAFRIPPASLTSDYFLFSRATFVPIVHTAIFISGFYGCITWFLTAARILKSLAQDRVFPFSETIVKSSQTSQRSTVHSGISSGINTGGESIMTLVDPAPIKRALPASDSIAAEVATIIVVSILLLIFPFCGDLDASAAFFAVLHQFGCAGVNIAALIHNLIGAPNWRSLFRHNNSFFSASGFIVAITLMLFASPTTAGISLACILVVLFLLFFYHRKSTPEWGQLSMSIIFHHARQQLLRLRGRNHIKYWRPNFIYFVDSRILDAEETREKRSSYQTEEKDVLTLPSKLYKASRSALAEIGICNSMKKGGLLVISSVLPSSTLSAPQIDSDAPTSTGITPMLMTQVKKRHTATNSFIKQHDLKAFSTVIASPSLRAGVQTLLLSQGIGGMRANTVIFELPDVDPKTGINTRALPNSLFSQTRQIISNHRIKQSNTTPQLSSLVFPAQFPHAKDFFLTLCDAVQTGFHFILFTPNFDGIARTNKRIVEDSDAHAQSGMDSTLAPDQPDSLPIEQDFSAPSEQDTTPINRNNSARGMYRPRSDINPSSPLIPMKHEFIDVWLPSDSIVLKDTKETPFTVSNASGDSPALGILSRFFKHQSSVSKVDKHIGQSDAMQDVPIEFAPSASFSVLLGHIITHRNLWKSHKLRVRLILPYQTVGSTGNDKTAGTALVRESYLQDRKDLAKACLEVLLAELRISSTVTDVVEMPFISSLEGSSENTPIMGMISGHNSVIKTFSRSDIVQGGVSICIYAMTQPALAPKQTPADLRTVKKGTVLAQSAERDDQDSEDDSDEDEAQPRTTLHSTAENKLTDAQNQEDALAYSSILRELSKDLPPTMFIYASSVVTTIDL
ncbi:Cation-chloride cotransporter [Blattamonas nauphoetae]|uniref:Cation-chloride cotransporter n=1 Tax=Blattamonas nauphoetae TaxID=2049346 RepID=A0ABQ9XML6_9EUKA|nr:Cation-chloride cotransporter [Blattamonas nauphoetae]